MQINLPNKPKIIESSKNQAVFEIEGCFPGYGLTLGNSFRRVLLSSLSGVSITGVKIKGAKHEFSTIPNVKEDVIQIILNLKQVRFKLALNQPTKVSLKVKGEREVTAADIKTNAEIEVINPEALIATLTSKKAELEMEMDVEPGLGYSPVEARRKEKIEIGKIAIDANFSPIRKVNYTVEPMRVGDRTDFNRLTINLETDGSITPEEAFQKAANILVDHFKIFGAIELTEKKSKKKVASQKKTAQKGDDELAKTKIEELKLSTRTIKALTEGGFKTVAGLAKKKEEDLLLLDGFGQKGIKEVKAALKKIGFSLKENK